MAAYPKTERRIKEGRGQGSGAAYVPWIHVRDFSSQGMVSRFRSWKSGRTIQCLSSLETSFAYLLEWSDAVLDYYEQYPLLPLEETLALAEGLGLRIPTDDGEPRVRTTDFLLELQTPGGVIKQARSIKTAGDLDNRSKLLALDLERRYWRARGTDWAIVTELELPRDMVRNIEWVHSARTLEGHDDIAALPLLEILPILRAEIEAAERGLAHTCLDVDRKLGLKGGTSLFLVRHQLATKAWKVDMRAPIKTETRLHLLHEEEQAGRQGVA